MKRNFLFLPVCGLLLAGAMGSCSKPESVETPNQTTDSSAVDKPAWEDTITFRITFGEGDRTRGSLEDAKVSELWLMDFVNGELQQTIHQQKTDAGFGSISMAVSYGTHALRLIASAGSGAAVADSIVTWAKPGDTFFSADTIDIQPQGSKSVTLHLKRIATRLRVSISDEIPADFAQLGIAATWYYGLNAKSGEATGEQSTERTISVPASYAGTTGQLTAGFYSLCPVAGYTTDATITARDADGAALRSISLTGVPLQRNRITAYSGEMFQNTRSVGLDVDTDWADALEATW